MQLPRKIASSTGVSFTCKQCGKVIKSDYLQQGDSMVCPHCNFEQDVPVMRHEAPMNLPPGASQYVDQDGGYAPGGFGGGGLDRGIGGGMGPGGFQHHVSSHLAGRGERLIAQIIDSIVFLVSLYLPVGMGAGAGFAFFMVLCFAGVQIYLLTTTGQTIGKKVMNIKIVKYDDEGEGGFVTNVLLRGVVNGIINMIPFYFLVDTLFIFRDDQRCIHDLIASTKVIKV